MPPEDAGMKTQGGTELRNTITAPSVAAMGHRPLVGRCFRCDNKTVFTAHQVAASYRIWKLGSGRAGVAAVELLGGDGTTNQCSCGMECEVVCTGKGRSEVRWRPSQFAAIA
jgi:hypothetical protein